MPGSVLVPFPEDRDVFVDDKLCGRTNAPFDVEVGTHQVDLGEPIDYDPVTKTATVKSSHTPLKPLRLQFTKEEDGE